MLVNAMEACEGSAEPSVSVRIIFGERKIVVAIEDNGRGLRSEDFERVFHGHSTKVPAGGLGLSAARRAIEAHSGRIQVRESAPWERTVFELELHRSTA
jgi:C4-dicarboxylate-specific signal transduction histidine kinase